MKPIILIAEDGEIWVHLFKKVLPRFLPEYSIVVRTNRAEALAGFSATPRVAALVIDRFLPPGIESRLDAETARRLRPRDDSVDKEGGFALIRDIAAIEGAKAKRFSIPTLFISCDDIPWGDRRWLTELYAPGVFDELLKPFEIKYLAKRLKRLIASSPRASS